MSKDTIFNISTEMGSWMGKLVLEEDGTKEGIDALDYLKKSATRGVTLEVYPCLKILTRVNSAKGTMDYGFSVPLFGVKDRVFFEAKRILSFSVVDDEETLKMWEDTLHPPETNIILPGGKKGGLNV